MTANTHVTRTADGDLALGIIDVDGEGWDLDDLAD